jgi:hypothetical protein
MNWFKRLFAKKIYLEEATLADAGFRLIEVDPDKNYILFVTDRVSIDDLIESKVRVFDRDRLQIVRVY